MNREELHSYVSASKGNESNICQICVIKGGEIVYKDSWRGFKPEDGGFQITPVAVIDFDTFSEYNVT